MQLIDCHTHTQYSMDSEADIRSMINKAIEFELAAYAITDHCECNCWYPKEHYEDTSLSDYFGYNDDFEASVAAVTALKEEYGDRLNMLCGTEMGQATQSPEIADIVTADSRLDFVIGSLHQIRNEQDFFYIDYSKMTSAEINDLLERYFKEIYELCCMDCFDILGHLTYCTRYMSVRNNIEPDISPFDEIIAESLRTIARNGKGIEINTSGLRKQTGVTYPTLKYVKMFRDLGGEIISVGSDAHKVRDLGSGIAEGAELAKAAGFRDLCYFKNRKPQFIRIK